MHGNWIFCYAAGEKVEAFFQQGALVPKPIPDETAGAVGKAPPVRSGAERESGEARQDALPSTSTTSPNKAS
jgi:hypothetical protein